MWRARLLRTRTALARFSRWRSATSISMIWRAPAHQLGQQPRRFIRQFPRLGLHRLGKAGDHRGIDRIGLGALADRLREVHEPAPD